MDISKFELFRNQAYINGEWIESSTEDRIDVINPATNQALATIPALAKSQLEHCITHAEVAFQQWKKQSIQQRSTTLKRWFQLIVENKKQLAAIMTLEQGKPLKEAEAEILYAASFIEWFAEEGRRMYGETIPAPSNKQRLMTWREPIGVCALITPWNFPSSMITRKAAPAIMAGCTVIIKPSQQTPFSALALAALAEQAGIPKGVINVVTGRAKELVPVLTESQIIRKLSFTGSTAVGAELMAASAPSLKRLSLELGGNAPFIVFEDADIELAVKAAISSKFRNNGQTCVCSNRFFVHADISEQFVAALIAKLNTLKVGDGLEADTDLGPLINQQAVTKLKKMIDDATAKGAKVVAGGQASALGGNFFQPTVITNAHDQMQCFEQEIFAPLAPISIFHSEQEVIDRANATEYGLASYICTNQIQRAIRVSEALQYGMVGLNTGTISMTELPFGGVKSSGFGREGSKYGLDEYTEIKSLCIGL